MSEIDWELRLKDTVDSWFYVIIASLIILSFISGAWAYEINLNTRTIQDERVTDRWTEETDFEHSIISDKDTDPYSEDEKIKNNGIYYKSLSDTLNINYVYDHNREGNITIDTDTYIQIRGVEYGEDNEISDVYWKVKDQVDSKEETLTSSELQTVGTTINITELSQRITNIRENQLKSDAGFVDIRYRAESTAGIDDSLRVSEAIIIIDDSDGAGTYRVVDENTITKTHEKTELVKVEKQQPIHKSIGSSLVFIILFSMLISTVTARLIGYLELTKDEEEMIEIYKAKKKYDEWITKGEFPSNQDYNHIITVDDLEGLVDVAIDTNKRVIEDEQLEVSTVLDGDYIYMYIHPGSNAASWILQNSDGDIEDLGEI